MSVSRPLLRGDFGSPVRNTAAGCLPSLPVERANRYLGLHLSPTT